MKKLFLVLTLAVGTFTIKAQELTFDQTADYIKIKLNSDGRYSENVVYVSSPQFSTLAIGEISIDSKGEVKIVSFADKARRASGRSGYIYQPLDFNLTKILKIEPWSGNFIQFFITDNSCYLIEVETQVDAKRLVKAFNHLKSILPKDNDPFAN